MARTKLQGRLYRRKRVRSKVAGTSARPRLSVFRSLRHIYAQIVDDISGKTIAHASTLEKELKGKTKKKAELAKLVGACIADRTMAKGIKEVVFDRGGFKYHGLVKALADGAREKGLVF